MRLPDPAPGVTAQRCFSALKTVSLQALVNFPINAAALIIHQTANEAIKFFFL